jgi:RNA polymerase sigma-70 factor, ECF subfamily
MDKEQKDREFTRLANSLRNAILAIALRSLGSSHEAEEAAQDILCKVYFGLENFRGECQVTTWVFTIANNVCATRLRQRLRNAHVSSLSPGDEAHGIADPDTNPEEILDQKETVLRVKILLRRLPKLERNVATLYYADGLEYKEIAGKLGVTTGTVSSSLSRVRAKMPELAGVGKGGMEL